MHPLWWIRTHKNQSITRSRINRRHVIFLTVQSRHPHGRYLCCVEICRESFVRYQNPTSSRDVQNPKKVLDCLYSRWKLWMIPSLTIQNTIQKVSIESSFVEAIAFTYARQIKSQTRDSCIFESSQDESINIFIAFWKICCWMTIQWCDYHVNKKIQNIHHQSCVWLFPFPIWLLNEAMLVHHRVLAGDAFPNNRKDEELEYHHEPPKTLDSL